MKIHEKIQLQRKKSGLSQEELAFRLDVSRQSVYKWETGASAPELDRLKKLAEVFGVSYEYLLNDDLDEDPASNPQPAAPPAPTYRSVFMSGTKFGSRMPEADHGYPQDLSGKNRYSASIFQEQDSDFKKRIEACHYTKHIRIQHDLLLEFFTDNKRNVIGFYWNRAEQFVCPYENLIDVSITENGPSSSTAPSTGLGGIFGPGGLVGVTTGSVPVTTVDPSVIYAITISYYDKTGATKTYKLVFNCSRSYVINNARSNEDTPSLLHGMIRMLSPETKTHLNSIRTEIIAARERAQRSPEKKDDLDLRRLRSKVDEGLKATQKRLQTIAEIQIKEHKRSTKVKIVKYSCMFGIPLLALILILVIAFSLT